MHLRAGLVIAGVTLLGACQPSEAVYPIVGPDGSPMAHVSCPDAGRCYQLAGEVCPNGYDTFEAMGDPNTHLLVRCRARTEYIATEPNEPLLERRGPPTAHSTGGQWVPPEREPQVPWKGSASTGPMTWPPSGAEPQPWPQTANSGSAWPPVPAAKPEAARGGAAGAEPDIGY